MSCVIPPQNQLVMRKTHSNLLWHSTSHNADLFLEWLLRVKLWSPNNPSLTMTLCDSNSWHIICQTMSYVISPQNELVMRKTHSNLLWHSTSYFTGLFLEWLWSQIVALNERLWHFNKHILVYSIWRVMTFQ